MTAATARAQRECSAPSCARPAKTRGMCGAHAERVRSGTPLDAPIRAQGVDVEERVEKGLDCWGWTGPTSPDGYGRHGHAYAHRLMYARYVGPIPDGLHIDHLCRNRSCVNPAHLEAVQPGVNTLRGFSPSIVTAKTGICQRGHELTAENTYTRPNGKRACRTCIRSRWPMVGKVRRSERRASA